MNNNNKRTSRACVFIDSSNPSMPSQVINGAQPFIKPPFPPTIEPRCLLKRARDGSWSKAPNAFIIYRKLFIETARSDGYYLPMTVISSMASQSWEQESQIVKDEYKRLAKEAFNLRNEMLPKSIRRRKREKWNIVTFEDDEEDKFTPRLELIKAKPASKPKPTIEKPNPQLPLSPISLPGSPSIESQSPESQSPESPSTESQSLDSPLTESFHSTPTISPLISPVITPNKELQFTIPTPTMSTFDSTFDWYSSESENNERYLFDLMIEQQSQQRSSYLDNLFNEFSKFPFDEHDDSVFSPFLY